MSSARTTRPIIASIALFTHFAATAQEADAYKKPLKCEALGVTFSVTSLSRNGPGVLQLNIEILNESNDFYGFSGKPTLIDNEGDEWENKGWSFVGKKFMPDIKTKWSIEFNRSIGGRNSTSATFTMKPLVSKPGYATNYGYCNWLVKGIPIT